MNLEDKFRELQNKGEGAHMPHVYYGDPHEEFSLKLLETLAANGADILEFGIPFQLKNILHEVMVQKRDPHLKGIDHAHSVHFVQHVTRQ